MSVSSGSVRSLLELAEKATPGPWVVHGDGAGEEWVVQEEGPTLDYTNVNDIRLIAEMRNLVPALAQEWEAMRTYFAEVFDGSPQDFVEGYKEMEAEWEAMRGEDWVPTTNLDATLEEMRRRGLDRWVESLEAFFGSLGAAYTALGYHELKAEWEAMRADNERLREALRDAASVLVHIAAGHDPGHLRSSATHVLGVARAALSAGVSPQPTDQEQDPGVGRVRGTQPPTRIPTEERK